MDMINVICSDPCIACFDCKKRSCLPTDFSKNGFGYEICQLDSDYPASMASMHREMWGGDCKFLLPESTLRLCSTGFVSRTTHGRESSFHSHLRGAFTLDWAIHKCRAKPWGVRFTALPDYFALWFILSYNGPNPVLLWLQMRFQPCPMDLYHRTGTSEHLTIFRALVPVFALMSSLKSTLTRLPTFVRCSL